MDSANKFCLLDLKIEVEKLSSMLTDKVIELENLEKELSSAHISPAEHDLFNDSLHYLCILVQQSNTDLEKTFRDKLNALLSKHVPSVPWEVKPTEEEKFTYLIGESPWGFTLEKLSCELKEKAQKIMEADTNENGWNVLPTFPSVGETAMCVVRGQPFRAIYLGLTPKMKLKVVDIDSDIEHIVEKDQLFQLAKEAKEIPPHTIRCCLIKESFYRSYWSYTFGQLFSSVMRQAVISLRICGIISVSCPPRYLVELNGKSVDGFEVNLSQWFLNKLIPSMVQARGDSNLVDFKLDPFVVTAEPQLSAGRLQLSEPSSICSDLSEGSDAEVGLDPIQLKHRESVLPDKGLTVKSQLSIHAKEFISQSGGNIVDVCEKSSSDKRSVIAGSSDRSRVNTGASQLKTSKFDLTIENVLDLDVASYSGEAQICKFYGKKGHCWKVLCDKEHVGPVGHGYKGSLYTYASLAELLDLPEVGELVTLKITSLINGHVFYAQIQENAVQDETTLKKLEKRVNNHEEVVRFQLLDTMPALGELVLACSDFRNYWFRARIVELLDDVAKVMNIDYGQEEYVHVRYLRKFNDDLLFIPAQAVRCTLYDLCPVEPFRKLKTMVYIKELILGKYLQAKVEQRDILDTALEIILYLPSGISLNDKLMKEKLYRKIPK